MDILKQIKNELFLFRDLKYKEFHSKLMPTINPDTIIGVRVPILRSYANKLFKKEGIEKFLLSLPHNYYEENNLHAFLIEKTKDYDECIQRLERFLPYVDNWATCDMMRPKCLSQNKDKLILKIKEWILSEHTYTVRFGIEMLMIFFADDEFSLDYLELVASIKSEEYYINMMLSWYFATLLAKQYESTIPYLEKNILPVWVHNKTIQKAVESYRISIEKKEYLKKLKRK